MSLLEDVSIVVTPNGYKAGTLYGVLPTYAEGADKVDDGDFPLPNVNWILGGGAEVIVNGLRINNTVITGNAYAYQTISGSPTGNQFVLTYDVIATNGKDLQIEGGTSRTMDTSTTGTNRKLYYTWDRTNNNFAIKRIYADTDVTIDNVILQEVTSSDMDVTRATAATRVDEDGLIEDVLSNVPRIDYTGGGCPHILAEPQRTNLIPYSEAISTWNNYSGGGGLNPVITDSYVVSPDGSTNASRVELNTNGSSSSDVSGIAESIALDGSSTYTFSFYIKSNSGSSVTLTYLLNSVYGAEFTATTEWQRFDVQVVSNSTNARNFGIVARGDDDQLADISFWGAQLEEGSYATSYIPNFGTDAGVTRNQDVFTRDGIGSLINDSEGVLFVEMAALADDGTYRTISLNKNSANDEGVRVRFNTTTNTISGLVRDGGSGTAQTTYQVSDTKDFHKVAFKYKSGESELWVDGVNRDTSADTFTLDSLNNLNFNQGTASDIFYGKVKQLQVYPSALTTPQLRDLTT